MPDEFSAVREEIQDGDDRVVATLRDEIRGGDENTRREMRDGFSALQLEIRAGDEETTGKLVPSARSDVAAPVAHGEHSFHELFGLC